MIEFLIDYALMTLAFAWMARDAREPRYALMTAPLWPFVWLIGVEACYRERRLIRRMRKAMPGHSFDIIYDEVIVSIDGAGGCEAVRTKVPQ